MRWANSQGHMPGNVHREFMFAAAECRLGDCHLTRCGFLLIEVVSGSGGLLPAAIRLLSFLVPPDESTTGGCGAKPRCYRMVAA
jgi:hypothetical protein